jgi:trimethylamine--corrinoid protein Co-methyltransferase
MAATGTEGRRRGGREARRAVRARPLALADRPVWPGLEGGRYLPLRDAEVLKIHRAALDVLERIGFADAIPSCVEITTAKGAFLNAEDRLCFPKALVEDVIAKAGRHFPLFGQDQRHDLEPYGKRGRASTWDRSPTTTPATTAWSPCA